MAVRRKVKRAVKRESVKEYWTCRRCNSKKRVVGHHVTYRPSYVAPLCTLCHAKITALNTAVAIATGITKTNDIRRCNENRMVTWKWFLKKRRLSSIEGLLKILKVDYEYSDSQIEFIEQAGNRCL